MTGVSALACPSVPNGLVAHTVYRSQLVGTQGTGKYLSDLFIVQTWLGSAPTDPPSLKCLSHVLRVGTSRQMLGLHADRAVTAMQNMQARRYGAVKDVVADPVGIGATVNAAVNPAVAVSLPVAAPIPAPVVRWRLWHNPLELLPGRKTVRYGHGQRLLLKHLDLRFHVLLHALTVSCKRSRVNA